MTAMKADGPVKAIEVCMWAAPAIAGEASTGGWTVKRTSLKLRDARPRRMVEKQTLEFFEAEKAKDADVEQAGARGNRRCGWRADLPLYEGDPHGGAMPGLPRRQHRGAGEGKAAAAFSADQATGYKAGDIRGAFTISKPLK